ncbi:MAG: S8 family serine peptidase [Planctomycetes bacterium]|nr:S8 family serine peptidase [Planctomycetota bacterium]
MIPAAATEEPQEGVVYFNTGPVEVAGLLNLLDDSAVVFESDTAYMLMLDGPITNDRRSALEGIGAALFDYLPKHAYVALLGNVDRDALRRLGFVTYVGVMREEWKIDPQLTTRTYTQPDMLVIVAAGRLPVVVTIFGGLDPAPALETIKSMPGGVVHHTEPLGDWFEISAEVPANMVASLARLSCVQYIEPAGEITLRNSTNRWIVQSNVTNVTPLYTAGIHGEGQVVGVIDGKADRQHCSLSGTKILFYNTSESPDDVHGTHVSCTAVGNAGIDDNTRGVAYLGNMVFNTIPAFNETAVNSALTAHSNQGARIHTNSWGDDGTTSYNSMCRGFDLFNYQHEDDLVCLAVTNTGSLKNPENAKNLLAVGASADTPNQANFCSGGTGPTADSRRKPEIFAPGCSTTSATPGTCGTTNLTGTSMASPAVAGTAAPCATILRRWLLPKRRTNCGRCIRSDRRIGQGHASQFGCRHDGDCRLPQQSRGMGSRLGGQRSVFQRRRTKTGRPR